MTDKTKGSPSAKELISELALTLQRQDGIELHIEVPTGTILTISDLPDGCQLIDETAVRFDSLIVRNTIVATAAFENLQSSSGIDADALFMRAYELWCNEIGHSDQASGRLLALASACMDVITVGAQRIRDGADVFDVLHLLEAALPYLHQIEIPSIINLFAAKFEPTKNDMAGGAIHSALEAWLGTRAGDALRLHAAVQNNLSEGTASLQGIAILALAKTDYSTAVEAAITDARADIPLRARVGIQVLGRLLLIESAPLASIQLIIQEISSQIERGQGEQRSHAIRAAVEAMHVFPSFDPILLRLAEDSDQDVLCVAATALFLKAKELSERGIAQQWLELMALLKPEFKFAIRDWDHAMSRMLSDPANTPIVVSTLKKWVAKNGRRTAIDSETAKLFGDTVRKLFQLKADWTSLVTDWLLSDAQEHPAALAGFLNELSLHLRTDLSLDKGQLDSLETEDLLFLARRMIGYVYDRAQLTSLTLSMLLSKEPATRIYPVLHSMLVDEIGYDYPGSTANACRKTAETDAMHAHRDFLLKTAETIDQIANTQSSLPILNELRPPTKLRRLFARARAKQMNESIEEADANSIFRQIATHIPIKAGRGTFSYRNADYGPSMKLSSTSHSIELPRREAFDPVGNSIRHLGFRLAKREKS